ncbi:STE3-like pheromone receptor [Amylostereum chailletii]|nr:STE3-like pheromone receptor [Amylostereum chailletii]
MDPTYPLFPIFAFLGFLMTLVPLPWHLHAWNSGTCFFMFWTSLSCLIQFINALVWHNNILNVAPVYCDITTKILVGASVGIPASGLCISRRLYNISAVRVVSVTRRDKIRSIMFDCAIAVLLPFLVMALHIVVQGHRANILEDVGCVAVIFNTAPAYPLVFMWPALIGSISFVYAALTLRAFMKHRASFFEVLSGTSASLTANQYLRFMILACTEMLCTLPLSIYTIVMNATRSPIEPWISWADTHFNWNRFEQVPSIVWHSDSRIYASVELTRWLSPFCAIAFFMLFGLSSDARRHYRKALAKIGKAVGIKHTSKPKAFTGYQTCASIVCISKRRCSPALTAPALTQSSPLRRHPPSHFTKPRFRLPCMRSRRSRWTPLPSISKRASGAARNRGCR